MAILLNEEGMEGRYRMYATDINEAVLHKAEEGVMPLAEMQRFTRNYQKSGGTASFADYYTARYDRAILSASLRKNIVFAPHNLATDAAVRRDEHDPVPQRDDLFQALPQGALPRTLRQQSGAGRLSLPRPEGNPGKKENRGKRMRSWLPRMRIYRKGYGPPVE